MFGMIERGGKVRATLVEDTTGHTLKRHVRESVEPGSSVYTDQHRGYTGLSEASTIAPLTTPLLTLMGTSTQTSWRTSGVSSSVG